jgi:hypothetical protein
LTELCEHKNNDFCNELSEFIQSDDEDHSTNNICDEDDDDDIDLDIDDDVRLSVSVPKKKTRRKYIKNKYNSSSSLICDGRWLSNTMWSHPFLFFWLNLRLLVARMQEDMSYQGRTARAHTQACGQRARMLGMR